MQIPSHVRSIIDHDGAVILDVQHNAMHTLDPTAGYVWQRLQQGKGLEEIVSDLCRDTGTEYAVVLRDVSDFFEQLKAKHLLDSHES